MTISDHTTLVIRQVTYIVLASIICGVVLFFWFHYLKDSEPVANVGVQVIATPAKEVKSIPKATVAIKNGTVRVYEGSAKIKLNLPEAIAQDPAEQVFASTKVKADDHPQTITTTINTDTGEATSLVRRDPLPWLAWDDHGEAGVYGGIKNGTATARLEVKQGIFQVKAVHVGMVGTLDQPLQGGLSTDYYLGVGAWYRW